MKKTLSTFIAIFIIGQLIAQVPHSFHYQAIVRDNSGRILVEQPMGIRISLISGEALGPIVYSESHQITTNQFGLVNIAVGNGKAETGEFKSINWGKSPWFIKLELDKKGGNNYKNMGISQLLSVPYALYAETSGNSETRSGEWTNDGTHVFTNESSFPGCNVGIGTNAPAGKLQLYDPGFSNPNDPMLFVQHENGFSSTFRRNYEGAGNALFLLQKSRGTRETPAVVQPGDNIGQIRMEAFDGSQYKTAAWVRARVDGVVSEGIVQGALLFATTDESGNVTERLRVDSKGNIAIGTSMPESRLHVVGADTARLILSPAQGLNSLTSEIMMRGTFADPITDYTPRNLAMLKASFDGGGWESASLSFHVAGFNCNTDQGEDPCERMRITSGGKVGIGTTDPQCGLHVVDTNGVLFTGEYDKGTIPAEGPGTRMMWYPAKAAFRVGKVNTGIWDDEYIGTNSVAMGYGSLASGASSFAVGPYSRATGYGTTAFAWGEAEGAHSVAIGYGTEASGDYSLAMGKYSQATGNSSFAVGQYSEAAGENSVAIGFYATAKEDHSVALGHYSYASGIVSVALGQSKSKGNYSVSMGFSTVAEGSGSTAMGHLTKSTGWSSTAMGYYSHAIGSHSTAMGHNTNASSYVSVAIGRYNVGGGNPTNWVETDPLFEIGNGTSTTDTANALTVLKNGNTAIGTYLPTQLLSVYGGEMVLQTEENTEDQSILFQNSGGHYTWRIYRKDIGSDHADLVIAGGKNADYTLLSENVTFKHGGNVGIGTTIPSHILHVNGIARSASATWATTADRSVMGNIGDITGSLEIIEKLHPVSFTYTNEYSGESHYLRGNHRGFIAQEVKEILPEMVSTCIESFAGKTFEDLHLLNTSDLIPILVSAVQEQQEMIRKLENRIEELERSE